MSGERADILSRPDFRWDGVRCAEHQTSGFTLAANTDAHSVLLWEDVDDLAHAPACSRHDRDRVISLSARERRYLKAKPTIGSLYLPSLLLIITAVPSARTRSRQSCQSARLEPEELSAGPSQNGVRQGQAPCSISLLIPVHLSFSSATYPLHPPGPHTGIPLHG